MCPDCADDSGLEGRGGDGGDDRPDQMRERQASGGLRRSKRSARKPSVQTETKYIELMVVNDNEMVSLKCVFTFSGTIKTTFGLLERGKLNIKH